jgi:nucleotide-binding universal stress UspA family protein
MYKTILVPVENSPADATILAHIRPLARLTGATLILLHVADGWAARNLDALDLQESEEMQADRNYLQTLENQLSAEGLKATSILARGSPPQEIIRIAREKEVDLIAMSTHGHRWIGDLVYGTTVTHVRHEVEVPVLLLKSKQT